MAVQTKTKTTITHPAIHHHDGRVTEIVEYNTKSKRKKTETFFKLDDYGLSQFNLLSNRSSALVFLYLSSKMDSQNNINIDSFIRKEMSEWVGAKNRIILYSLSDLIKIDFIRRISRGNYMVNPSLSTRVAEEKIKKLINEYNSITKETK